MLKQILIQQLPYNLVGILILLIYLLKKNQYINRIIILSLVLLFLLNVYGELTPDVRGYISILNNFKEVGPYHTEKIYYDVAKIVNFNIYYFRGVISGLGYFLLFYYLKFKETKYKIVFMMLFLIGFSFESLNIIRMFLGTTFFLNGIDNWNQKRKKAYILLFLSVFFHKSYIFTVIIFLFSTLLSKMKRKKLILYYIMICICFFCIFGILLKNTEISGSMLERIGINKIYFEENIKYEGMFIWQITLFFRKIFLNLVYLFLILLIMKKNELEKEEIFSIISILIYFLLAAILKNTIISGRFILNSILIIYITYSKIILKSKSKLKFIPLILLCLIYFVCNNIMILRYLSWNIMLTN